MEYFRYDPRTHLFFDPFPIELFKTNSGKRVALYIRVSTHEQMNEGYGLEAQEQNLRDYLKSNITLGLQEAQIRVFTDSNTGSELNRPGLQKLLDEVAQKKIDVVVVWKIDRLARILKHLIHLVEKLEAQEISFISVQENMDFRGPIGRLVFHLFSAIAEFERHLIKDRTLSGKIASAKMGNFTGGWAPYGYRKIPNPNTNKGSVLEIDRIRASWVKKIFGWYVHEGMAFDRIALRLNELEVPYDPQDRTSKNNRWSEYIIFTMIRNPIYRGIYVANKKAPCGKELPENMWTTVKTPTIVDTLLWHQAQSARTSRRKFHGQDVYLLSGKILDADVPGLRTFIGVKRSKGGFSYRRKKFTAPNGEVYSNFEIPGKQLEARVWNLIEESLSDPRVFYESYLEQMEENSEERSEQDELGKELKRRVAQIEQKEIPRIHAAYEKGIYSDETTQKRLIEKEAELNSLGKQLEVLMGSARSRQGLENEFENLEQVSKCYRESLSEMSRKEKKILCDLLIEQMTLRKEKVGQQWQINGEIVLRFDHSKAGLSKTGGRTRKHGGLAEKSTSEATSLQCGDPAMKGDKKSRKPASFVQDSQGTLEDYRKSKTEANRHARFVFNFEFHK